MLPRSALWRLSWSSFEALLKLCWSYLEALMKLCWSSVEVLFKSLYRNNKTNSNVWNVDISIFLSPRPNLNHHSRVNAFLCVNILFIFESSQKKFLLKIPKRDTRATRQHFPTPWILCSRICPSLKSVKLREPKLCSEENNHIEQQTQPWNSWIIIVNLQYKIL